MNDCNLIFGIKKKVELSILIPTFRDNKMLYEAIDSAINQKKYSISYEIIVCINNPNFDTKELKNKYSHIENLLVYKNSINIGMKNNLNRCSLLSNGEYICYLHDDDLLKNNYLYNIEKIIHNKKYSCIIPARYIVFSNSSSKQKKNMFFKSLFSHFLFLKYLKRRKLTLVNELKCVLAFENCFYAPTCGTLFYKKDFIEFGMFNGNFEYAYDYDFFINYSKVHNVYIMHKYLGYYRMTDSASNKAEVQLDFWNFNNKLIKNNQNIRFVKKNLDCYYNYNYKMWSDETKKLILKNSNIKLRRVSKIKYLLFRIRKFIYKYHNNLDCSKNGVIK